MLGAFIAAFCALMLGGFAWDHRKARRPRQRRRVTARAPFRRRLAAQSREVFGGSLDVRRDGEPLSESDAGLLAAYERDFERDAREPRRARRRP